MEPETLRQLLRDLKGLHHYGWQKLADQIGYTDDNLGNFINGKRSLPNSEVKLLAEYILTIQDAAIRAFLLTRYRKFLTQMLPVQVDPGEALVSALDLPQQHQMWFSKSCANRADSRFLLMRREGDGGLVTSFMKVEPATQEQKAIRFFTFRPTKSAVLKRTRGFMLEIDGRVYSYGSTNAPGGIRTTNLMQWPRGLKFDLMGLRLGVSRIENQPFAHKLYCYRLPKTHQRRDITPLLGHVEAADIGRFAKVVDDFDNIYRLLKVESVWDNGLHLD